MLQVYLDTLNIRIVTSFNGHPPLGVNATDLIKIIEEMIDEFQWAPTLGGECYAFQAYNPPSAAARFNGHPPLGVNATVHLPCNIFWDAPVFQWAPTLGGECYSRT